MGGTIQGKNESRGINSIINMMLIILSILNRARNGKQGRRITPARSGKQCNRITLAIFQPRRGRKMLASRLLGCPQTRLVVCGPARYAGPYFSSAPLLATVTRSETDSASQSRAIPSCGKHFVHSGAGKGNVLPPHDLCPESLVNRAFFRANFQHIAPLFC